MLNTIIKKEILEAIKSFRFLIAVLLCLILIPLGMYVNLREYQQRQSDYQEAVRLYQQRSNGNIKMDFPAEGYRPPSVLSIFSVGLEYFLPNKVITSRSGVFHLSNDQGINNPQSLLFGKVDLLFNVSFVISLLALIFTFNLIAGEKEDGTLRIVMANPIPRWKILFGKIIGNYVVLLIPFLIAILLSLVMVSLSGVVSFFSSIILPAFLVILVVTLLFILAMFNLGILISTLTHRSITAMVALLFVWTIFVLSLPRMSPMIAEIIFPVKSPQVLDLEKSLVRENYEKELDKKRRELYDKLMNEIGMGGKGIHVPPSTDEERAAYAKYDEAKKPLEEEYEQKINSEIRKLEED